MGSTTANNHKSLRRHGGVLSATLLVCSLLVAAVSGELLLRLLGYHGAPVSLVSNIYLVDDPILDWRYLPNKEIWMGRVRYAYNSSGFRDVEHAAARTSDSKRIVVLGDSVTEGYGVRWEAVFASRIQAGLGDAYEVVNLGMAGLNTPQEIHLLQDIGVAYKPSLIVLNFILNDYEFYTRFHDAKAYTREKDERIGLLNIPINSDLKGHAEVVCLGVFP